MTTTAAVFADFVVAHEPLLRTSDARADARVVSIASRAIDYATEVAAAEHERRLRAMHAMLCAGPGAPTFEEWLAGLDAAIAAKDQADLFAGQAAPVKRQKSPKSMRAGFARAAALSPERRSEIASIASAAAASNAAERRAAERRAVTTTMEAL